MIRCLLAFAVLSAVTAKTYERCELARELKYEYEVLDSEVGTWVCIAEHESQYNTSAVGMVNGDGSSDHGIFQINDEFWCSPPGKGWACGLSCADLEDDDIENDFNCARKIYKEHKTLSGDGFNAWAVYKPYCKGQRAQKYVEGCFNETDEVPHRKKTVPTKKVYPWLIPRPSSTTPSPEKTNEELPRCFIRGNDLDENISTEAVSAHLRTVSPEDNEAIKTILPANSVFSSGPVFSSIASVSQSITNQPTLSRFSNNIPSTDGRSSSPTTSSSGTNPSTSNVFQFSSNNIPSTDGRSTSPTTSSSDTNPSTSNVFQSNGGEATSSKFDSSIPQLNSFTQTSKFISSRPVPFSQTRNILPPSPILSPALPTTSLLSTTKPTPVVSVRTVIGPSSRFTSPPAKITFTPTTEVSTSSQRILSQRVRNEPSFIVNGMVWV